LQILYKTNAKGSTQEFRITVEDNTYTVEWGKVDGKFQSKTTECFSKNVGKKNETTPEQQALAEAQAVHAKKLKSGYSTDRDSTPTVLLPMKVNEYVKHKNKVVFPCYTSVKLDGINGEYRLVDGELKLLSRGGEEYCIPEHHRAEVLELLEVLGTNSINGELYIHGEYLQDISSAVKKPNELTKQLKFYVFDFPEVEGGYATRCKAMYDLSAKADTPNVPLVMVGAAYDEDDIEMQFNQAIVAGYEGLIVRNSKGLYKYNTRSLDVFKFKKAMDEEFKVVGFKLDKNKHAVYELITGQGATFSCKRKGSTEDRLKDAVEAPNNIGKYLKVEFERYSKDNIPLKPVGLMFRAVDSKGEAVE